MRRAVFVLGLVCAVASGQAIVEEAQIRPELRDFTHRDGEPKLECEVLPVKPALTFSFRFQTGYVLRMPMKQFLGPGHHWGILVRVTPREGTGKPVYLAVGQRLPDIPKNKATFDFSGGFVVGEGRYNVDWVLADETGRTCRKSWRIEAKPSRGERDITLAIAPDTVDDIFLRKTGRNMARAEVGAPDRRVTVLLHATPLTPWRTRLRGYDRLLLLSSLATLVERLPSTAVRVVLFSLAQQKEFYRQDNFDRRAFNTLARTLNDLELGMVDYSVLTNRKGHVDLFADLVTEELEAAAPADAVVVLGPAARFFDKVPKSMLEERESTRPRFFYFQYKPYLQRGADFPDIVTNAIKRIGGKTSVIRSPADFGKAIDQLASAVIGTN